MSAPDPDDIGLLGKLIGAMGVALTALGTWAWSHTHKRIDNVGDKLEGKASADEVMVQRGHIAKLFDKVEELGDRTELRFSAQDARAHQMHIELLNAIHSLKK